RTDIVGIDGDNDSPTLEDSTTLAPASLTPPVSSAVPSVGIALGGMHGAALTTHLIELSNSASEPALGAKPASTLAPHCIPNH
ncbi:MAG TPA: hypothetical protein VME69_02875, partial [Methylocella sp.]|nr:hypothetical protein [Methylocella sp.]